MKKVETSNKRICKFYNDNENINFEAVNLIFIDLMEKLINDMSSTLNSSINSQILSTVSDLNSKVVSLNESVSRMNSDITNTVLLKFIDVKKEYIEDVKTIIQSNSHDNSDKLASLIEKNNTHLIDRTQLILSELIPKNNEGLHKQVKETMDIFQKSISEETNKLSQSVNNDSLTEFMKNFESKSSQLFQQPIFSCITATEERISNSINGLKDVATTQQTVQDKLSTELNELLNRYRNSSFKGKISESQLESLLTQMFSSAEIINTSGLKASGDFIMKRENNPTILFENKDYDTNIPPEEVKKFIRDTEEQKCHGIFLSQRTGITSKSNYQIDFHKGNILVYIHYVDYSREKVQVAVDVIDTLSEKLTGLNEEGAEDNIIPKETLDEINIEFQAFLTQKDTIITLLKDSHKKILGQMEDIKFPGLEKYLSTKFASVQKTGGHSCEICNNYTSATLKGLAAHRRGCSKKNIVVQTEPSSKKL